MEQQTAVDWLFEKLWDTPKDKLTWNAILEEAKQMEKEQTLKFARNSVRKVLDEDEQNPFNLEEYYNETYNKTNKHGN